MTKKKSEILSIKGQEKKLEGDQDEEQPEKKLKGDYAEKSQQKKTEKKIRKFFSTSDRPPPKRKTAMLTTRCLDANGKLIKKREATNE